MEKTNSAPRGMVTTPHHLASQSALDILRAGGTAMEAVVAAAATIAVVYPHMNSIGGDGFWLIMPPDGDPLVIQACGPAGSKANLDYFTGLDKIPYKGPKAANTVAGTIGGWHAALEYVTELGYKRLSTARLLADAIDYAENGCPVSFSFHDGLKTYAKREMMSKEFMNTFLPHGRVPEVGEKFYQKALAESLKRLAKFGLDSFYRGELADVIAEDMQTVGMPITRDDLKNYFAVKKTALKLIHSQGEIFNVPPPTQGLASLAILGILDKLSIDGKNEGEFIHATVEATKQAFLLRDTHIADPRHMKVKPESMISNDEISRMASNVDLNNASTNGQGKGPGDTIWLGVMDNKGFSVSFIQSIYHDFGSGVVLPKAGFVWQNRGVSFTLNKGDLLCIKPGKLPLHTLNPAAARLNDGRVMVYGTRGGDGQPQTQAAIFHRHLVQGIPLQESVSAPRWVYGRTVGDKDDTLKLEDRFSKETINYLKDRGHVVDLLPSYSEKVGQAGALVRNNDGCIEGAFDPRSDGSAVGF